VKATQQPPCHAPATRSPGRTNLVLWLAFAAWCVTLFILSSIPGNRFAPPPFSWADKVVHTFIFTTGSFLLVSACRRTFGASSLKAFLLLFVAMLLIGVSDEFHQTYTPGRSGNDRGDLTADALGALIGLGLAALLHGKRPRKTDLPSPLGDRAA
jgi:VanZ family protein